MSKQNQATHFLLIGNGRLANHLKFWLSNQISNSQSADTRGSTSGAEEFRLFHWHRSQDLAELHAVLEMPAASLNVLLAISDGSLAEFWEDHLKGRLAERAGALGEAQVIHFSGATVHPEMRACHPLASFSSVVWSLEFYDQIGFIVDEKLDFKRTFPFLKNASVFLPDQQRSFYHAQCVMGGNFSTLLWTHMQQQLAGLGVPTEFSHTYLRSLLDNFEKLGDRALTGPIVRGDLTTIASHQKVLSEHEKQIYQAFLNFWRHRQGAAHEEPQ